MLKQPNEHETSTDKRQQLQALVDDLMERAQADLAAVDEKTRLRTMLSLLPYVQAKAKAENPDADDEDPEQVYMIGDEVMRF